ncbi:13960_t:CDS:2, partial [Acaulospora colombiana]
IVTQTPSNPRSSQRTPNPSRQHRNKRDSFDDPEEKIFKENPLHFVSPEYAQKCIDNDDYDIYPPEVAQEILDKL